MKRILVALLAGTMVLVASGCGGSTPAPATAGEPKPDAAMAPAGDAKPAEGETK